MKKILFYNSIIIMLLVIITEMTIGFFFPITKQGIDSKIINENLNKPKFNLPNIKNKKVFGEEVYTDKNGFRVSKDESFSEKDVGQKKEIYFVGGSVTFGNGVKQENTFSGLIAKNNKNYKIFNASVVGSDLENNYYIVEKKINKNNLKYIIINFSLDDIHNVNKINTSKKNKEKESLINKLKKNKILSNINNFIRANSKLYVVFKNLIFNAEERYYLLAKKDFLVSEKLIYLKENLDKISELNRNINNKIIFISIPYSKQVDENNCLTEQFEEKIIQREMSLRNIKFYNLKNYFCKNHKNFYLKFDPAHLSILGHTEVYNYIQKEIL